MLKTAAPFNSSFKQVPTLLYRNFYLHFLLACASCSIRDTSYCPYGSSLKDIGIFSRFSTPSFPMPAVFYFYSSRFLTNFWPLYITDVFYGWPLKGAIHKLCRLGRGRGVTSPKDDLLHRPYLIKNCWFWDNIVYGRPFSSFSVAK